MPGKLERVEVAPGDFRSLSAQDAQAFKATGAVFARETCPTCGGTGRVAPGGAAEPSGEGNGGGAGTTSPAAVSSRRGESKG